MPPARLALIFSVLCASARGDIFAVAKTTRDGATVHTVQSWPSPSDFISNTRAVNHGNALEGSGGTLISAAPNGDLYTTAINPSEAGRCTVLKWRDVHALVSNASEPVGIRIDVGSLVGTTFDENGRYYTVEVSPGTSDTYEVRRYPSINDFVLNENALILGTRSNGGLQLGFEFINGRLYSVSARTSGDAVAYDVWDWGASFTGFLNNTGSLLGTRTDTAEIVGIFSTRHGNIGTPSTVARTPMWRWLGNKLPAASPGTPGGWATENAFPNLTFVDPIKMLPRPGANELWVIGRQGVIWAFENRATVSQKRTVLDLSDITSGGGDCGMLGIAFHPQFGQTGSPNRGYVYLFYNYRPAGSTASGEYSYNRLSRFTLEDGATTINPASELVLINQFDEQSWHNGGDMFFGPDKFLYLSVGDEGGAGDEFDNSQKLDNGLFSGVLRIDVDRDASRSHPIRRQPQAGGAVPAGWPATFSQGYFIPNDNPWLDPNGTILEEFWAVGLRSPHRMSRDEVTGQTFIGDVGQNAREEIDLLTKGANFEWSFMEGEVTGFKPQPNPPIGTRTPPLWSYSRDQGDTCVIGGCVYRGPAHADELAGKYIFGDFGSGRVWSMTWQGASPVQAQPIAQVASYSLSGFGLDHQNELYLMTLGSQGRILKLSRSTTPEPPATLSALSAFSDLATLTPAPGVLPFDVNSPLWSDDAAKQRWIALPNNGAPFDADETITFNASSEWQLPVGTVLIKHFELPVDETNPAIRKRLETRFSLKTADGGWAGYTYKWRADGSDADLLSTSATEDITIATAGGTRTQQWYYPSRSDCLKCHNSASTQTLGLRTWQLNGTYRYPGTSTSGNQLQIWSDIGMFDQTLSPSQIAGFLKSVSVLDASASLEARVRSYLDSNCAHCHRPDSGIQAFMDARFSTPLALQGILDGRLNNNLGIAGAHVVVPGSLAQSMMRVRVASIDSIKMPPLAKNVVDTEALAVIDAWIISMGPPAAPDSLTAAPTDYGTITLTWETQSTNHASFKIERSLDGTTWTPIASPAPSAATWIDAGLQPNTTYQYRIAAINDAGASPCSAIAVTTTWPAPGSWLDWQRLHPLGGQNAPHQNPDGDTAANLLEWALGADPASGGSAQEGFHLTDNAAGGIDAVMIHPSGLSGVTFTLLASPALANPMAWSLPATPPVVTNNPDGTRTIRWADLDLDPTLAAARQGFVRLAVRLTSTGETACSATWFWDLHEFANSTRSFGPTMLQPERFSGRITSGSTTLDVAASAGSTSVVSRFDPGKPAFVEITSGAHNGHRFDIDLAASTATLLALNAASPHNTRTSIPDLSTATFIARDHWTLSTMFPVSEWQSGTSPGTADRVQFYHPTNGWIVYWVANVGGTSHWVRQGDATLADQGGLVIAPGTGLFVRKVSPATETLLAGVLRPNVFALPMPAGLSLMAGGWPADQSPAGRAMLIANGFTGSNNPANADQFLRWAPDLNPAAGDGYVTHFLLNTASLNCWTPMGNASLPDENDLPLFGRHRANFLKLRKAQPGWTLPLPWNP